MKEHLNKIFGKYQFFRDFHRIYYVLKQQFGFNVFKCGYYLVSFSKEYREFTNLSSTNHSECEISIANLYPCLLDKTSTTPIEPTYFYQDTWGAGKIFQYKPESHVDVGSSATTVGIISEFVPTTMVDIRPLTVNIGNLTFKKGSITELPFEDNSIESLSSLCVIEHIGLGRYGDKIDPKGTEKAISELKRVLGKDGNLLISVPVDYENKIYFNAHRAFTRDYILKLFSDCELVEEKYIYGNEMYEAYDSNKGFGTGLFHFKKSS